MLAQARLARADQPRVDNWIQGAIVHAGFAMAPVGDAIMGDLGGESAGLRSGDDRRWLLRWDVLLAMKGGYLGNQHPFLFMLGMRSLAWVAEGYRFMHASRWSPYAGGRLGGAMQLLGHPGLASDAFDTINSVDGVGGVVGEATGRVEAGVSFLDDTRSLLLLAFMQEQLQAPRTNTPGLAFTQGGLGARFDLTRSVIAELEGVWGVTANRTDALRGITDQTTRIGVSGTVRKIFGDRIWLGATVLWMRDTDSLAYTNGLTYGTANPATLDMEIFFGVALWRRK